MKAGGTNTTVAPTTPPSATTPSPLETAQMNMIGNVDKYNTAMGYSGAISGSVQLIGQVWCGLVQNKILDIEYKSMTSRIASLERQAKTEKEMKLDQVKYQEDKLKMEVNGQKVVNKELEKTQEAQNRLTEAKAERRQQKLTSETCKNQGKAKLDSLFGRHNYGSPVMAA